MQDEQNVDGLIKFKNEVICSLHCLDVKNYTIFETDIFGTKGRLRILNHGNDLEYYDITNSRHFSGYKELMLSELPINVPEKREVWLNAIDELVNSLENKKPVISSGRDGLHALAMIDALVKSANTDSQKTYLKTQISQL